MWALKSLGTYNKQLGLASAQPTSMTIPQILSSHTQAVAAPGYTELPRMTQRVPPSFPPAVNHPIAYNRLMARRRLRWAQDQQSLRTSNMACAWTLAESEVATIIQQHF